MSNLLCQRSARAWTSRLTQLESRMFVFFYILNSRWASAVEPTRIAISFFPFYFNSPNTLNRVYYFVDVDNKKNKTSLRTDALQNGPNAPCLMRFNLWISARLFPCLWRRFTMCIYIRTRFFFVYWPFERVWHLLSCGFRSDGIRKNKNKGLYHQHFCFCFPFPGVFCFLFLVCFNDERVIFSAVWRRRRYIHYKTSSNNSKRRGLGWRNARPTVIAAT